ncbi:MAG: HAMP domain-containing protein [Burkholderiales bacterium]|nr:HAMP domain-containing protein [Burkholderiales bacterium]
MRLPVRLKLIIALSAFVVFGLAVIALLSRALSDVRAEVDKLAQHRQPLTISTHKIEVNVNGIGLAVLAYLESARPDYRAWVDHDRQDIDRLMLTYANLADSERERQLGTTLRRQLDAFAARATTLLDKSDALNIARADLAECVEELHHMLIDWIDHADKLTPARHLESTRTALAMEAELSEISLALGWHPPYSAQTRRTRFREQLSALELLANRFDQLPASTPQRHAVTRIVEERRRVAELIERTITLEDDADSLRELFIEERATIDRLLAGEVQTLAHAGFEVPLQAIDRLTESASIQLGLVVLPLFAAGTLVLGLSMYRGVTRPLAALKKGIRTVARGDEAHPITGMPNDEFGDLAIEFNKMARQLVERSAELAGKDTELRRRETMACMGTLVSGVAHEVRNPLFGITSTLDALQARLHCQPEYTRHIAVLRGETARLQKLMQDLLDFGRPLPHARAVANLHQLIDRGVRACAPLAQSRGVAICCELDDSEPWLALDTARMEQVLVNLIENALQHSPRGAEVTVATRRDYTPGRDAVVVTVCDQGPGFRKEDLPRIFEPFFTRRSGGTGLGLSIVQRIVEEHGGRIEVANRPEGGATLTIHLLTLTGTNLAVADLAEQPSPGLGMQANAKRLEPAVPELADTQATRRDDNSPAKRA